MERVPVAIGAPVILIWQDSASVHGWKPTVRGEVATINTVGFVVGNNEAGLTVSTSRDDSDSCYCPLTIPWPCIVTLEEVNL
jgi:hypothetical protein